LLVLSLATGLYRADRIRRKFSDGKTQRLEGMIDRVIDSLATYAASEKATRERYERERIAAAEAQKRREAAQLRQELENKRVEFLDAQMKRLKRAREIESFVSEIEKEGEPPTAVRALLDWATEWAGELREAISHEALRTKIERVDLMNDEARIYGWVKVDD
jgi:predicted  nucleic acid-binding Zn-ribbon protein